MRFLLDETESPYDRLHLFKNVSFGTFDTRLSRSLSSLAIYELKSILQVQVPIYIFFTRDVLSLNILIRDLTVPATPE